MESAPSFTTLSTAARTSASSFMRGVGTWPEAMMRGPLMPPLSIFRFNSRMPSLSSRSEERRVGKECRSRCDWSSDVCSSDLLHAGRGHLARGDDAGALDAAALDLPLQLEDAVVVVEIGRASCRERV